MKSSQALLLSETQTPQQQNEQDGEGQGPHQDVVVDQDGELT